MAAVESCEHDWRADPRGFVYSSNPPSRRIACAKCGAIDYEHAPMPEPVSRDPKDWPPAGTVGYRLYRGGQLVAELPPDRSLLRLR